MNELLCGRTSDRAVPAATRSGNICFSFIRNKADPLPTTEGAPVEHQEESAAVGDDREDLGLRLSSQGGLGESLLQDGAANKVHPPPLMCSCVSDLISKISGVKGNIQ